MKFREIYCNNCKKMLGRYNTKFYDSDKISEILKSRHSSHVRKGHRVIIRDFDEENLIKFLHSID